jgi:hypothetical protein
MHKDKVSAFFNTYVWMTPEKWMSSAKEVTKHDVEGIVNFVNTFGRLVKNIGGENILQRVYMKRGNVLMMPLSLGEELVENVKLHRRVVDYKELKKNPLEIMPPVHKRKGVVVLQKDFIVAAPTRKEAAKWETKSVLVIDERLAVDLYNKHARKIRKEMRKNNDTALLPGIFEMIENKNGRPIGVRIRGVLAEYNL